MTLTGALTLSGVTAGYDPRRPVVEDVSFAVSPGEAIAVMGKSGVGKSTLFLAIAGYLKPSAGTISIGGQTADRPDRSRLMVFQDNALWPWLSVLGNVLLGTDGGSDKVSDARDILKRLDMGDVEGVKPAALSGGMQKRVEIARALCARPAVLVLDEAFRSLDPGTKQLCLDVLAHHRRAFGTTVIASTHDFEEVSRLADRLIMLDGEPARIFSDQRLEPSTLEQLRQSTLAQLGYRT